jgi:hypothetical protein
MADKFCSSVIRDQSGNLWIMSSRLNAAGIILKIPFLFISISKHKNLKEIYSSLSHLYFLLLLKISYFCFGKLYFKFGSEAGASSFLG